MKACVIHGSLNISGGGEKVCLTVMEILKNLGYKVTLISIEPTNWKKVHSIFGTSFRPDEEIYLSPIKTKIFSIYSYLLNMFRIYGKRKKCNITINTHGGLLLVPSEIIYIHFPHMMSLEEKPENVKYMVNTYWNVYFQPYRAILNALIKRIRRNLVLTNSEYTSELIEKYLGSKALVLYPPVNIDVFLNVSETKERENRVVLCGRYAHEKNYEFALEVAANLPDITFTIIGSIPDPEGVIYYRKLRRIVKRKKLSNVKLLKNVPVEKQVSIYSTSKVFLHAMMGEHFGIAVVEGMAAGLVPVVHRSGGAWLDILDRGRYGLGYETLEEATKNIEKALNNYQKMRERAIKRAMRFDRRAFIRKFSMIVREFDRFLA